MVRNGTGRLQESVPKASTRLKYRFSITWVIQKTLHDRFMAWKVSHKYRKPLLVNRGVKGAMQLSNSANRIGDLGNGVQLTLRHLRHITPQDVRPCGG